MPLYQMYMIFVGIITISFAIGCVESVQSDQLIWKQIGSNINGTSVGDLFGSSLAMSYNGTTIVVGAPNNDVSGIDSGRVHVYSYNLISNSFVQLGLDIIAGIPQAKFGYSVATSADGNTVVIGAPFLSVGFVSVYRFNSISHAWTKLGSDINGKADDDAFGFSVAMSADGETIAVGAPRNDGNGHNSGHVRVYSYTAGSSFWKQVGNDINGEAINDQSGYSVAISGDGRTIAIGAPFNDGHGTDSGHVRVYSSNSASSIGWTQIGSDINGIDPNAMSAWSVTMSSDGKTIAVGAQSNTVDSTNAFGHVHVYSFNSNVGNWFQFGSDISTEGNGDFSSSVVAMSANGKTLAIGAPFLDGDGTDSGQVRTYYINSATGRLVQVGNDIFGEASDYGAGWAVTVSEDGTTIAIGSPNMFENGNNPGDVRVYRSRMDTPVTSPTKSTTPTKSPVLAPISFPISLNTPVLQ